MNFREQGLRALKAQLQRIAASIDNARFQACLSGMYLPAIGGDYESAELIQLALELPPLEPDTNATLAKLAARLVEARALALEQARAALPKAVGDSFVTVAESNDLLEDENYVYNLFLLSSNLPRDAELFAALKRFHEIGLRAQVLITGRGRVAMQLRRAQIHQQTHLSPLETHC